MPAAFSGEIRFCAGEGSEKKTVKLTSERTEFRIPLSYTWPQLANFQGFFRRVRIECYANEGRLARPGRDRPLPQAYTCRAATPNAVRSFRSTVLPGAWWPSNSFHEVGSPFHR